VAGTGERRARYRAEARAEIKNTALAQIARDGVAALTLTGVAKELGVSGPALYKYFKGRDDLLTELIVDGYAEAAVTLAAILTATADQPPRRRLLALAQAFREWAVAQPHRYLLLTGAPVPRYAAPVETIALARDVLTPFITVLSAAGDHAENPELVAQLAAWMAAEPAVFHWVRQATEPTAQAEPTSAADLARLLATVLRAWMRLHGVVSTEAAGTFTGMGLEPATLLTAEMTALADEIGLPRL
jgi:AcrR family transcriptional regulator